MAEISSGFNITYEGKSWFTDSTLHDNEACVTLSTKDVGLNKMFGGGRFRVSDRPSPQ